MTLNPQTYARARIAAVHRPHRAPEELRAVVTRLLGGLDQWERPALDPRVTERRTLPGVTAERVELTTRPGLTASGWYLTPGDVSEVRPGILALPGHEATLASFLGFDPDGEYDAALADDYHHLFPLQLAQFGYPVFALEQIGFGERRPPEQVAEGDAVTSCHEDTGAALLLGETVLGWRVWDAMRALDYLQTRPEVDPDRLAVVGISGGGTATLFTAALDDRVGLAGVSAYLSTAEGSILAVHHCIDNYVPGLALVADIPDVGALIAPRLLWTESGVADEIFPVASYRAAVDVVRRAYDEAGAGERFRPFEHGGDHEWNGAGLAEVLAELGSATS